ncbi:hypothetical protein FE257_001996 [Aspergillus nanangensis]|uniref:Monopolin complex subunit Csm1/Pcs1 C-terminal domain-containing protein n=1 Tax=Aspergillus nanangensis TaxID=2582783 RepID=A0AAD4CT47_ASPNN|nr:hypothetical protein FE257_001996 [Aspergillus nanangensis]
MPKRKATTRISGLIGSDDEDVMKVNGIQDRHDSEPPTKKARGRPRSKSAESKPASGRTRRESTAPTQATEDTSTKRSTRRGRPKGSRNSGQSAQQNEAVEDAPDVAHETSDKLHADNTNEESDAPPKPSKATKSTKSAKSTGTRGRGKASTEKQVQIDGEFEYTPTSSRQVKPAARSKEQPEQPKRSRRRAGTETDHEMSEAEKEAPEVVDETVVQDEPEETILASISPSKRRQSTQPPFLSSPLKRKFEIAEEEKTTGEPELRRRLGDLTKKCDTLENRYRNLKEIGVVEANANVEKLRKQCESMTTASNNLIASLKAELEAQKALGRQSRSLEKQLKERDAEVARLSSKAEEATTQLSSAHSEVKALQTKLAAARNTAASLESAAAKVPGSAVKGGSNRANAAASAEAAHAAQFAQLKEDLYSDLTGLIIRDLKKNKDDTVYDCIQTGVNGTLHFKLVVPNVSSANFESAEFQYIPLLDENRDRELVDILPEYLTVDITFVRQQASKFYTRVIDALTKRRTSSTT